MNQYLSDKIKVLSFFSIIFVLYIHSGFHDYPHEIQGMPFNHYLQNFISEMIGRCAVPLFFAISGYLFFMKVEKGIKSIFTKMKKRVRTLLIPYVVAALFFPLFFMLIQIIPGTAKFINGGVDFSGMSIWEIIVSVFFDNGGGSPMAFQLWFLRDLIMIVAISPIIYWARKYIHPVLIIFFLIALSVAFIEIRFFYSLFWFVLGSLFLVKCPKVGWWIHFAFLVLCLIELFVEGSWWTYLKIPIVAIGLVSIWNIYDMIVGKNFSLKNFPKLTLVCGFTFFIYLFHEPVLNIIRKVLVIPFGHNSFSFAFSYLLSPWVFIAVAIPIGLLFKKYLPCVYSFCTGNR